MKTILIPVDLSATCQNVIKYVANLSRVIAAERVILLKSYYVSVYAQLLPSADFVQLTADHITAGRQKHERQLEEISRQLLQKCNPGLKVEVASSNEPLLRAIHQFIAEQRPDMVLVGTDGRYNNNESDVGQQVVSIAKTSPVPVLVIPPDASYRPLKQALVPCDFAAVSRLALLKELDKLKFSSKPELLVLNVDPQQKYLEQQSEHNTALQQLLESYKYKVYYTDDRDTVRGILNFADGHDVQLIIALPGKHSFFYNLTHSSITEALTLNAHKPVLILK